MKTLHSELVPAEVKDSRRLLVMLHGLGDSIEGYRWFPEAMRLPWLNYLLVNAPDDYFTGFSWFDLHTNLIRDVVRSRQLLFTLLDDLRARGFPSDQTVLGGFSQGCLMSIDVGLRYPHRLAGIIGLSGWVAEPETLLRELSPVAKQQRLLLTHGTHDPLIPFNVARDQVQHLKATGLDIEWHSFARVHTIAGEEELSVIRKFIRAGYPDVVGE